MMSKKKSLLGLRQDDSFRFAPRQEALMFIVSVFRPPLKVTHSTNMKLIQLSILRKRRREKCLNKPVIY